MQPEPEQKPTPTAPEIHYQNSAASPLLDDEQVLAVLEFGLGKPQSTEARLIPVHLSSWGSQDVREVWRVPGLVQSGHAGSIQWAEGGGWLMAAIRQDDDGHNVGDAAHDAYRALTDFLGQRPDYYVQRLWNYLDSINAGSGDEERYRQFCAGRLEGMNHYFENGFPAATAIGHAKPAGHLQVYCLASLAPGMRIENPRQLSAWCYPRQYGPVSPSFARAMRLPAGDGLAISGTAAIQGHSSLHAGDLYAQLHETLTNLRSLLAAGDMSGDFGHRSPIKAYVRHQDNMAEVDAFLGERLPHSPRLLLQADICRSELLVEIDGWHFA